MGIEDGAAEIAWQRRAELRNVLWQTCIVFRQRRKTVGRCLVVRVEELLATLLAALAGAERPDERAQGSRGWPRLRGRPALCATGASPLGARAGGESRPRSRGRHAPVFGCRSPRSPVGAHDANFLLLVTAEAQFRRREEPVNDVIVLARSIIDEFGAAFRANDEERRHLALGDAARKLDINLGAVVKNLGRTPGCIIALDGVAEPQARDIDRRSELAPPLAPPHSAGAAR